VLELASPLRFVLVETPDYPPVVAAYRRSELLAIAAICGELPPPPVRVG
jgi:hypothetical protein